MALKTIFKQTKNILTAKEFNTRKKTLKGKGIMFRGPKHMPTILGGYLIKDKEGRPIKLYPKDTLPEDVTHILWYDE